MGTTADESRLQRLVADYHDFNPAVADEVSSVPSALALARQIGLNRPLVIRRYGQSVGIRALGWTREWLRKELKNNKVSVAVTPSGNADAVVDGHFVEPLYEDVPFPGFLDRLGDVDEGGAKEVVYLQSQDDNLRGELSDLLGHVGEDVPVATEALGRGPDAVNLWIGDDRSVTSLHKDPFENFYMTIAGSKTFTLFPPTDFYCLHERRHPPARHVRRPTGSDGDDGGWGIEPTGGEAVPWIPLDPLDADLDAYPRFGHARATTVDLAKGDLLYLPAMWFHHVRQSVDPREKMAVAVNWWYDMEFGGPAHALANFVRSAVLALDGREEET